MFCSACQRELVATKAGYLPCQCSRVDFPLMLRTVPQSLDDQVSHR